MKRTCRHTWELFLFCASPLLLFVFLVSLSIAGFSTFSLFEMRKKRNGIYSAVTKELVCTKFITHSRNFLIFFLSFRRNFLLEFSFWFSWLSLQTIFTRPESKRQTTFARSKHSLYPHKNRFFRRRATKFSSEIALYFETDEKKKCQIRTPFRFRAFLFLFAFFTQNCTNTWDVETFETGDENPTVSCLFVCCFIW